MNIRALAGVVTRMRTHTYVIAVMILASSMGCGKPTGSSPGTTPPLAVNVQLSPAAAGELARARESIVVSAQFYGFPTFFGRVRANSRGEIVLGTQRIESPSGGFVIVPALDYEESELRVIKNRELNVIINVGSTRHVMDENVLACSAFDNTVDLAARGPVNIQCQLMGEWRDKQLSRTPK